MTTKSMITSALAAFLIASNCLQAQVLTLVASADWDPDPEELGLIANNSELLTIGAGEVAKVLAFHAIRGDAVGGSEPNDDFALHVHIQDRTFLLTRETMSGYVRDGSGFSGFGLPSIAGPAKVQLIWIGGDYSHGPSGEAFCTIEIKKSVDSFVPSNVVVIPSDAAGPVEVVLESSADLIEWVRAEPGSYGATAERRFFRVRALLQSP